MGKQELRDLQDRIADLEKKQAGLNRIIEKLQFKAHLIDRVNEAVIVADPAGKILFCNSYAETLCGRTSDEVIGKNITEVTPSKMPRNQAKEILEALKKGEHWEGEFEVRRKDGSQFIACVFDSPVYDNDGKLTSIVGISRDVTDRIKAENTIRQSEEKFRSMFENAGVLFSFFDSSGTCLMVNSRVAELFVEKPEQMIGKSLKELHPENGTEFTRRIKDVIKTGEIRNYTDLVHFPGGDRYLASKVVPVRNSKGKGCAAQIISEDITEKKQVETRLEEAVKAGKVGLWDWDLVNDKVYFSDEWKRQLGYKSDEIGDEVSEWRDRIHPDDRTIMEQEAKRCIKNKMHDQTVEYRMRHKDGSYRWIMSRRSIIPDVSGRPVRMRGSHIDITEKKATEEALLHSEAKYRTYVENATIAIFVVDKSGEYVDANDAACELAGYSRDELLNMSIPELVSPNSQTHLVESFSRLRQTGKIDSDVILRRKDGEDVQVSLHAVTLSEDRFMAFCVDITLQKRVESALQESNFLLRTIIDSLQQYVYLLDKDLKIVEVNNAYCEVYGKKRSDLIGKTSHYIHENQFAEKYFASDKRVLETGESVTLIEQNVLNNELRWVEVVKTPTRDIKGNIAGVLGIYWDVTDRKRNEETLKNSEEFLKLVIDATSDAIWDWNVETGEAYFSPRWFTMLEYDPDELPSTYETWAALLHPDDREEAISEVQKHLLPDSGPFSIEVRMKTKSGNWIWILGRGHAVAFDEKNNPVRMVGSHVDITKRKKAEKELRESEERYHALFSNINAAAALHEIITDKGGKPIDFIFLAANPAYEKLTKLKAKDIIGKRGTEVIPNLEQKWIDVYGEVAQKGQSKTIIDHSDYLDKYWEVKAYSLKKKQFAVILADITDRVRAEKLLREERDRAQSYLDIAGVMFIALDKKGTVKVANKKSCEVLGYTEQEILGKNWFDHFLSEKMRKQVKEVFKELVSGNLEPVEFYENPVVTKDGTERIIAWHNGLTFDISGAISGILSSGEDITEQKRVEEEKHALEEQLNQAQKMESIGRLAGGIAHDFNNILVGILGYSELLKNNRFEPGSFEYNAVQNIGKGAERAADLTKQLLGFARGGKYNPVQLKLNEQIDGILPITEKTFDKKIKISKKYADDLDIIEGDKSQIEQIIMNLLINAKDAMPDGGNITISTENTVFDNEFLAGNPGIIPGRYVKMSIADSGEGMTEEVKTKIFEPFFTTKHNGQGTGLGLATVYGIVKNHNGLITVRSEPGKGSVFNVFLPSAGKQELTTMKSVEALIYGREVILVVDDEEIVRDLAGSMLKQLGYKVLLAKDGEEAVDIFRQYEQEIDLVLLDLIMPKMGGEKTNLALREIDPDVKILLCSGYSEEGMAQEVLNDGALGFIQKPFRLHKLSQAVAEALKMNIST